MGLVADVLATVLGGDAGQRWSRRSARKREVRLRESTNAMLLVVRVIQGEVPQFSNDWFGGEFVVDGNRLTFFSRVLELSSLSTEPREPAPKELWHVNNGMLIYGATTPGAQVEIAMTPSSAEWLRECLRPSGPD